MTKHADVYRCEEYIFMPSDNVRAVKREIIHMKAKIFRKLKAKHFQECMEMLGIWKE